MGECSCGTWYMKGKHPKKLQIYLQAIEEFNKSGKLISSGDHHSGACFVFFKGDSIKVDIVVEFIQKIEQFLEDHPEYKTEMKIKYSKKKDD